MSLKRKYEGPPIDMTEQYISERDEKGETVAGTTEDDYFTQNTDWLPSGMDEGDFTDMQKDAIRAYLSYADRDEVTMVEIAEGNDFSKETARRAIHKAFPDIRGFDDINDSTKLAVLVWAHEGTNAEKQSLVDKYPISSRALGEAIRVYPDLIKEKQPISQDTIENAVKEYNRVHARTGNSSSSSSSNTRVQKQQSEKVYPDDFSELYEWFIDAVADNPEKSAGEIGDLIPDDKDYSKQNYYNVINDYGHVIKSEIKDRGTATSEDDLSDYLADKIEWSEYEASESDENTDELEVQEGSNNDNNIDRRLRAVESKVETLRQTVEDVQESNGGGEHDNDIVDIIINSMSDEQIGQIIRGAMANE